MTSGASTPNNESTTPATTTKHNAIDNHEMNETDSRPNDIDSDEASSCEEEIEEKVQSQSSDENGDSIFNSNTSNESSKLMAEPASKPAETKPRIMPLSGAKSSFGGGDSGHHLLPLRAIKETKSLFKTQFHMNDSVVLDKIAETSASDSKVVFNVLKADLPGIVSFSKNDVYEIDYSDYETDTSRSLEPGELYRKKNVRFEDESFQMSGTNGSPVEDDNEKNNNSSGSSSRGTSDDGRTSSEATKMVPTSTKEESKYCCPLKCNHLECSNGKAASASTVSADIDSSERIIEEYKREIEHINRRHELELKWSGNQPMAHPEYSNVTNENGISSSNAEASNEFTEKEATDYWDSPDADNSPVAHHSKPTTSNASDDSPTRDSTSTVINNYLKTKANVPPKATSTTSIKVRTSSATKKPPNGNGRKIKSAQSGVADKPGQNSKLTKARSISCLQHSANDAAKLNEFHIDKVESWMSTHHEDTFSDTALSTSRKSKFGGSSTNLEYKKAWRETPTSNKTDDEGNFSLDDQLDTNSVDDSSYGEIELVLKKMEGRRMKISFGNI